jgi:hypothetical protein
MTRNDIKDLILEIIEDIDDEAEFDNLDPDQPLRDQLDLKRIIHSWQHLTVVQTT